MDAPLLSSPCFRPFGFSSRCVFHHSPRTGQLATCAHTVAARQLFIRLRCLPDVGIEESSHIVRSVGIGRRRCERTTNSNRASAPILAGDGRFVVSGPSSAGPTMEAVLAIFNIGATFTSRGLLEHYWSPTDPRPTYRDLLWVWPWGGQAGISAQQPFAQEAPAVAPDSAVAALKNGLRTRFGLSETGGSSGPITF
jgi:hypothetical protein